MMDTVLYLGPDVVIPLRSALNFNEEWTQVGAAEFKNTWHGETKVIKPTFGRKNDITISADGNGVWRTPSLRLLETGGLVTLHSKKKLTWDIPAGTSQTILPYVPVPGSVRVVRMDGRKEIEVPHTQAGKLISIAEVTDVALAVFFCPITDCRVGAFDMSVSGPTQPWEMKLQEASVAKAVL